MYPNREQATLISKHFGCVRWIYNWALAAKTKAWADSKKRVSRYDLDKQLPILKKTTETEWLKEVNAQSLQQAIVHLELAFDKFFKEKKGYPKFKSKRDNHQSFSVPQSTEVDFESQSIYLPKIGWARLALSRTFNGQAKTVTVSRTPTGKHFVSVLVDDGKGFPAQKTYSEKTTIGIDVGLAHFATLSTGEKIDNPRHLNKALRRLASAQRHLARKQKGSKNRNKQRIKVARIHERVTNCRKDFLHKLSTRLVRENQALAFETLNIKGMIQNRKLARHISDVAWGMFGEFL
jgi:putative transposase